MISVAERESSSDNLIKSLGGRCGIGAGAVMEFASVDIVE